MYTTGADKEFPLGTKYVTERIAIIIIDMMRANYGLEYVPSDIQWRRDPSGNWHLDLEKPFNDRKDAASIFLPSKSRPNYEVGIYNREGGQTYQSVFTINNGAHTREVLFYTMNATTAAGNVTQTSKSFSGAIVPFAEVFMPYLMKKYTP
jgi:hypothetical protein